MQKNKGISLIVLVITIIVMIILAGAIILSLNNNGIIGKANEAVDFINEANVKQLADLKWAEAYLNTTIQKTDKAMREYVMDTLEDELGKQVLLSYDIQVTTKGVTVEKLLTATQLQEKHAFKYYSSLARAIEDVNAGTVGKENSIADANKSEAFAGAYIDGDNITVVLLKDATGENSLKDAIRISKDVTINLGGYTLEFQSQLGISGVSSDDTYRIIIDGRLAGSKIELYSNTSMTRLFQTLNDEFVIKGGTYIANTSKQASGESFAAQVAYVSSNAGSKMQINDANITVNMLFEGTGETINEEYMIVSCVNTFGEVVMSNCVLTTDATKVPDDVIYNKTLYVKGIEDQGSINVNNTEIYIKSDENLNKKATILGVDTTGKTVMLDSNITIDSAANIKGVYIAHECELTRISVVIRETGDETTSVGISNTKNATTTLTECNIEGADTQITNQGVLYIDGVEQAKTVALTPQNVLEKRKYC